MPSAYREKPLLRVHLVTIFPNMLVPAFEAGVLGRALRSGLVKVETHDPREHTVGRHRSVDDSPYGGEPGMVMMASPLFETVEALEVSSNAPIVLLSPQGERFTQAHAERLARSQTLVLICGRYDGIDERVAEHLATESLSIGDYVLSGGEPASLVVIDAVARLVPGVLGHGLEALEDDTYTSGLLQHPQYTRPPEYRGWAVPEVLLSGDHAAIARWRRAQALKRTLYRRPDLLERAALDETDLAELREMGWREEPQE